MLIGYLTLLSGLLISAVAIYYSVEGLVAIYPAMVVPIVVMGIVIELGKLSLTVWLKQFWDRAPVFLKAYMMPAVAVLMLITSIGVFGFLSKAHSDQSLVSGDVQSRIAIYDEKIKTAKENIEANRKQLKQMDEAVDQVMGRSTDEKGADKANAIRKSQQRDRVALAKDIEANQKIISQLNDEAAPIRAEVRKVEADVGPIKYIAAFIYGANPDANVLEKAVTWVTVLIVIVLDPLAVVLLLASQYSFAWAKEQEAPTAKEELEIHPDEGAVEEPVIKESFEGVKDPATGEWIQTGPSFEYEAHPAYEADDGTLTEEQWTQLHQELQDQQYAEELLHKGVTVDPNDNVPLSDVSSPEEDEAFEMLTKQMEAKAPVIEYQILDDVDEEEYVPTPKDTVEIPEEESKVEYVGEDYVKIDGQIYHTSSVHPNHADKLTIKHTEDSVIIEDESGKKSEHKLDTTYIQNEEQSESNKWLNITAPITETEYLKITKEKNAK